MSEVGLPQGSTLVMGRLGVKIRVTADSSLLWGRSGVKLDYCRGPCWFGGKWVSELR